MKDERWESIDFVQSTITGRGLARDDQCPGSTTRKRRRLTGFTGGGGFKGGGSNGQKK